MPMMMLMTHLHIKRTRKDAGLRCICEFRLVRTVTFVATDVE